jgi:hypothetical protein
MQYGVFLLCGRFVFPLFTYAADWLHRETFLSECVLGQKHLRWKTCISELANSLCRGVRIIILQ